MTENFMRDTEVDALRGFALMGIAIVHFMEQYVGGSTPQAHSNYTQHVFADGIMEGRHYLKW